MSSKGNQSQQSSVPEKKMGTGTTYGGQGVPMEVDAVCAKAKCYRCGGIGHFERDCPKSPKTKEEVLRRLNYYWDHIATDEKMDSKVEEVKDRAEQETIRLTRPRTWFHLVRIRRPLVRLIVLL